MSHGSVIADLSSLCDSVIYFDSAGIYWVAICQYVQGTVQATMLGGG